MLLVNAASIRDVVLFPHLRPRAAAPSGSSEAAPPSAE
jgi:aspartyl-tRNA synthetase